MRGVRHRHYEGVVERIMSTEHVYKKRRGLEMQLELQLQWSKLLHSPFCKIFSIAIVVGAINVGCGC